MSYGDFMFGGGDEQSPEKALCEAMAEQLNKELGDVAVTKDGRKWVKIADSVVKVDEPQWFKDIKCPISDDWIYHPRPLYGLTKHGEEYGFPKFPKYEFFCMGKGGEKGQLITLEEIPFRIGEITYYGCLNVESFKKVRDKRGEVSVVDDVSGMTVTFRTDKWAMLSLYNNLGEDTAVFTGEKWRPIAWFDEDNITVYADDPVCAPTMKEIYG